MRYFTKNPKAALATGIVIAGAVLFLFCLFKIILLVGDWVWNNASQEDIITTGIVIVIGIFLYFVGGIVIYFIDGNEYLCDLEDKCLYYKSIGSKSEVLEERLENKKLYFKLGLLHHDDPESHPRVIKYRRKHLSKQVGDLKDDL